MAGMNKKRPCGVWRPQRSWLRRCWSRQWRSSTPWVTQAAAQLTSSDGFTTLSTIGTVTAGTPYASGQQISLNVAANPVINTTNLANNGAPTTGLFYTEECIDPGGTTASLPTSATGCEAATLVTGSKAADGHLSLTGTSGPTVYDLPDPGSLGSPTMVGTCDVAPNQCVIGIFAANPHPRPATASPSPTSSRRRSTSASATGVTRERRIRGTGRRRWSTTTSPTKSTEAASTTTVAADGVNTSTITVSLKDTNGNPVTTGKSVTLSQGSGHSTIEVNGRRGDRDDRRQRTGGLHRQRLHCRTGDLHGYRHERHRDGDRKPRRSPSPHPSPPLPTPPSRPSVQRCPRVAAPRSPSRSRTRGRLPNPSPER